ncbi:DUF1924 domain-containing protein [Sulfurirhabdus autotrophica]|uniref:Uncharacterized protein DUF1924 n=1 Tax=Sulfurirhabdus autotrophica TaxID=1706046 RepID=A0A4R3YEF5_9PROT|nr:DUF1924 domain-containing protein [Sulfurirhabdus autotrophica]TCV90311.1 uncharacterized protein DUF1924 [Sulfurirhabdus autotrophica]
MSKAFWLILLMLSTNAHAASPAETLQNYTAQAKQENPTFGTSSSSKGDVFFHATRQHSNGDKVSCATCHTDNPKQNGKTRANKEILPMATSANAQRFTDLAKTEKWFRRNCQDVLERTCTAQEKSDFIAYLLSIK